MAVLRTLVTAAAAFGVASAGLVGRDFQVPSENGFPKPDTAQQKAIAAQAGGLLPNSPNPTKIDAGSATALQLIAFNELFETAYFSSLLNNVTTGAPGYQSDNKAAIEKVLTRVVAQEENHALAALGVLAATNNWAPSPCEYKFPVNDLTDAINLAETFTAVVLGALQDANVGFANDTQLGLVQIISSVIGQEGEQNGAYRLYLDRIPSESPFLTHVPAPFAFSALQMFIDSCPFELSKIDLPIFKPIMTNGGAIALLEPKDQTLCFSADLSGVSGASKYVGGDGSGLYMTYTTGQQLPVSVPLENVHWDGDVIAFEANFPFSENVMEGFSHGEITTSKDFAAADDVVNAALAGPAVIQVYDVL